MYKFLSNYADWFYSQGDSFIDGIGEIIRLLAPIAITLGIIAVLVLIVISAIVSVLEIIEDKRKSRNKVYAEMGGRVEDDQSAF